MTSSVYYGLAHLTDIIFNLITLLIIISVGISWFSADPYNPYVRLVHKITEPMYRPFRRLLGRFTGPLDLAPMFVMLIIVFLQKTIPAYFMLMSVQAK